MSNRASRRSNRQRPRRTLPRSNILPTRYKLTSSDPQCHPLLARFIRSDSPSGLPPFLRSPAPSTHITRERFKRYLSAAPTAIIVLTFFAIIIFCLTHPGYKITRLNDEDYLITATVTREKASRYVEYMTENGLTSYSFRDVRLPDGTMATASISLSSAQSFLESDDSRYTVKTLWRYSDHYSPSTNESSTIVRMPVKFTYQEIVDAIDSVNEVNGSKALMSQDIILPNHKRACCFLDIDQLTEYRLRMHVVGAKSIIVPFYWPLDGSHVITANLPQEPF